RSKRSAKSRNPRSATMSLAVLEPPREAAPPVHTGRQRRAQPVTNRVRRDGKFFRLGADKFYVKGVTYGPFAPNAQSEPFPSLANTRKDFEQIVEMGANCIRIYHLPPRWFLDL